MILKRKAVVPGSILAWLRAYWQWMSFGVEDPLVQINQVVFGEQQIQVSIKR